MHGSTPAVANAIAYRLRLPVRSCLIVRQCAACKAKSARRSPVDFPAISRVCVCVCECASSVNVVRERETCAQANSRHCTAVRCSVALAKALYLGSDILLSIHAKRRHRNMCVCVRAALFCAAPQVDRKEICATPANISINCASLRLVESSPDGMFGFVFRIWRIANNPIERIIRWKGITARKQCKCSRVVFAGIFGRGG